MSRDQKISVEFLIVVIGDIELTLLFAVIGLHALWIDSGLKLALVYRDFVDYILFLA